MSDFSGGDSGGVDVGGGSGGSGVSRISYTQPRFLMTKEEMVMRITALERAREFVLPIIEDSPVKSYKLKSHRTSTTITQAEQVVDLTLQIASWLMKQRF